MSSPFQIRGVIVPLVTPFKTGGDEIDESAMSALCDWLIAKGVHGLMPCGTTGEGPLLSTDERKRLLEVVLAAAKGRVPVIAHVGAATTRETIDLACHAQSTGIQAVSVLTPYYFPVSQQAMVEHFSRVANAVPDLSIFLYNIPSRTVNTFTSAGAQAVIERCPNVVGVKDSSGSLDSIKSFIGLKNGEFQIACGSDGLIFDALQAGAVASISGNGNAYPEVIVELFEAFWKGDQEKAAHQQQVLDQVRNLLQNGRDLSLLKRGIDFRGLRGGAVRPPICEFNPADFEPIAARTEKGRAVARCLCCSCATIFPSPDPPGASRPMAAKPACGFRWVSSRPGTTSAAGSISPSAGIKTRTTAMIPWCSMKTELHRAFPMVAYWNPAREDDTWTLSGAYGAYIIPQVFGCRLQYAPDRWPAIIERPRQPLEEWAALTADEVLAHPFIAELFAQMDTIEAAAGKDPWLPELAKRDQQCLQHPRTGHLYRYGRPARADPPLPEPDLRRS